MDRKRGRPKRKYPAVHAAYWFHPVVKETVEILRNAVKEEIKVDRSELISALILMACNRGVAECVALVREGMAELAHVDEAKGKEDTSEHE